MNSWPWNFRRSRKGSDTEKKTEHVDDMKDCANSADVLAIKGLQIGALVAFRKSTLSGCADVGVVKGILRVNENKTYVVLHFDSPIGNSSSVNKNMMQMFDIPDKHGLIATLNNFKDGKLQLLNDNDDENLESTKECVVEETKMDTDTNNNVLESHISLKRLKMLEGYKNKTCYGIQGRKNSCYIDTTLFSMFAFTNIFDYILETPEKDKDDNIAHQVRGILKTEIVNPLRKHLYCPSEGITKLRQALQKSSPKLEKSYMDAEEFLFILFDNALHLEHFVEFQESSDYMHQIFLENGPTRELSKFTTTQTLVEMSFSIWDIQLRKVPHPAYLIAMPRSNGQLKYCDRIVPCRQLDISNLMDQATRKCCLCGCKAYYKCKSCFGNLTDEPGIKSTYFCVVCKVQFHCSNNNRKRGRHIVERLEGLNTSIIEEKLNLLAVLCIKSNHYVCYVRCEEPDQTQWIFFDSDPTTGIPKMEVLDGFEEQIIALEKSQNLTLSDWDKMHPKMKNMLTDIYICIYAKSQMEEDEDL